MFTSECGVINFTLDIKKSLGLYLSDEEDLKCDTFNISFTVNTHVSQWVSDVIWTSNRRLYEIQTSYRRPLDVQRTCDAHWDANAVNWLFLFSYIYLVLRLKFSKIASTYFAACGWSYDRYAFSIMVTHLEI